MYHWPAQQKNSTYANFQYCRTSMLKFFLYRTFFYAVSTCGAASHGWNLSHHQNLTTRLYFLALTVLSDLESVFLGFIPHCVEQQWPCDLSVYKDECSINSKIKNKFNLGSKLIFNLIFQKINLYWSQNNSIKEQH